MYAVKQPVGDPVDMDTAQPANLEDQGDAEMVPTTTERGGLNEELRNQF